MTEISSRLEELLSAYNQHRKAVDYNAHAESAEKTTKSCKECKEIADKALRMYKDNELVDPLDAFHAAILLHHGTENEHVIAANELCKYAMTRLDEGHKDIDLARWLYAASYDRILVHDGKPQKFGTQFRINDKGEFEPATPVDPNTTDEERAMYGIPSLEKTIKNLSARYAKK